jgi:hypothetical protein
LLWRPNNRKNVGEPQVEFCDLCGAKVHVSQRIQSRVQGLEGRWVCDIHEVEREIRVRPSWLDLGGPNQVGMPTDYVEPHSGANWIERCCDEFLELESSNGIEALLVAEQFPVGFEVCPPFGVEEDEVIVSKTSETTLVSNVTPTDDPSLQIALTAGTYRIRMWLSVLTGAGGTRAKLEFTGTTTQIEATGIILRAGLPIFGRITALTGFMQNTNTGNSAFFIDGTIQVSSSGILKVQEYQDTSNIDPSVVHWGSYLAVQVIP